MQIFTIRCLAFCFHLQRLDKSAHSGVLECRVQTSILDIPVVWINPCMHARAHLFIHNLEC